jgi:hypothetical protein
MAPKEDMLPPGWEDLDRQMGQLFMMGFDGTSVNPQIRSLIENYHLGSVLLTAKNLKCIVTSIIFLFPSSTFLLTTYQRESTFPLLTKRIASSCRRGNAAGP